MSAEQTPIEVDGRRLTLTRLEKVLYPEVGFTKGDVIWYYTHVAPVILPHLVDRPVTFVRFPDGVEGQSFFGKHLPKGAPSWLRTVHVPTRPGRPDLVQPMIGDLPSLVWAANLAALELHTPMWRSEVDGEFGLYDLMVFDLDPGAPADIVQCCQVAQWVRDDLVADGLTCLPKTSGSKGLQLYAPLNPRQPWDLVHTHARELAQRVEQRHPDLVVSRMTKELRPRKVFIDWSQNHAAKTTISAYSLRARPTPTVSTPVSWDEVARCARDGDPEQLRFVASDVLERVDRLGDLFGPLLAPPTRAAARKRR